nr:Dihydrofolate reductase [uncultured bacterium]
MSTSPKISLVAAVAENGVIGDGTGMPWRIRSELKHFMQTTLHKPVIMGRKTFETLKAPLKDRANIVVTRDAAYKKPGAIVATSLDKALEIARAIAAETGADEIIVAGGAEIYRQALPFADRLHLTEIHAKPEGSVLFPSFDRKAWKQTRHEPRKALEGESADYTITVLERA